MLSKSELIFNATETYWEPYQRSKLQLFIKKVNCFQPLVILKSFILDIARSFEYTSAHDIYVTTIAAKCCFSVHPENIKKPEDFFDVLRGIEKQHRIVMG